MEHDRTGRAVAFEPDAVRGIRARLRFQPVEDRQHIDHALAE